jgi:hypothetical protein
MFLNHFLLQLSPLEVLLLAKWNKGEMERIAGGVTQIKPNVFLSDVFSTFQYTFQSEALLCSVHGPETNERPNFRNYISKNSM